MQHHCSHSICLPHRSTPAKRFLPGLLIARLPPRLARARSSCQPQPARCCPPSPSEAVGCVLHLIESSASRPYITNTSFPCIIAQATKVHFEKAGRTAIFTFHEFNQVVSLTIKIKKMNHIDAVDKDKRQLHRIIAYGFDLIQHYIVGRLMLKPTPSFFYAPTTQTFIFL